MEQAEIDVELWRQAQTGDNQAQVEFAQHFNGYLEASLQSLKWLQPLNIAAEEIDEIVADAVNHALEVALRPLSPYDPVQSPLRVYLASVAWHRALDLFEATARQARRHEPLVSSEGDRETFSAPLEPSPEERLILSEDEQRIWTAIDNLPNAKYKQALLLREQGLPVRSIAEALGMSEDATESLIRRALDTLYFALNGLPRPRRKST